MEEVARETSRRVQGEWREAAGRRRLGGGSLTAWEPEVWEALGR